MAELAYAADQIGEEYQIKGAYLLNFVKFVDWPEQAFKGPADPIAICILGENPFGPGLEQAAKAIAVSGRRVSVRQVPTAKQACQCHVVFVSAKETKLSRELLSLVHDESVLSVGESAGFASSGGVIGFRLEGEKIRIEISVAAADKAKLHISAKLMSLAQTSKK
jgi:hypothetical protein